MSQRIFPASECRCANCLRAHYGNSKTCSWCEQEFTQVRLNTTADVERCAAIVSQIDGDYGRDRTEVEEALCRMVLRSIANGSKEARGMSAALVRILDEEAFRLYA